MSRKAVDWAFGLGGVPLSAGCRLVLFILADCHNEKTGACFPSYETIAERGGMDRRTAMRHVKFLEEEVSLIHRDLRRKGNRQSSNQFDLQFDREPPQSDKGVTLKSEVQGDTGYTLKANSQGDKPAWFRVTTVSPKHKRTGHSLSEVIDDGDVAWGQDAQPPPKP